MEEVLMMILQDLVFPYLRLNFVLTLGTWAVDLFSSVVKVERTKFSTGVAKINSITPVTSNAPVPTRVCFSSLTTGLTWRHGIYVNHAARNKFSILLFYPAS
jgi:hypothetical protein